MKYAWTRIYTFSKLLLHLHLYLYVKDTVLKNQIPKPHMPTQQLGKLSLLKPRGRSLKYMLMVSVAWKPMLGVYIHWVFSNSHLRQNYIFFQPVHAVDSALVKFRVDIAVCAEYTGQLKLHVKCRLKANLQFLTLKAFLYIFEIQ